MFRGVMSLLRRLNTGLTLSANSVAEACLFGLMTLVAVDVVLRYVFNNPTKIADELSGYLLVGLTFMGATYALHAGKHIKVTLLLERLPMRASMWLDFILCSISAIVVLILAWKSAEVVIIHYRGGYEAATNLGTPTWMPQVVVPVGLVIFGLAILLLVIQQGKDLFSRSGKV